MRHVEFMMDRRLDPGVKVFSLNKEQHIGWRKPLYYPGGYFKVAIYEPSPTICWRADTPPTADTFQTVWYQLMRDWRDAPPYLETNCSMELLRKDRAFTPKEACVGLKIYYPRFERRHVPDGEIAYLEERPMKIWPPSH